MAPHRMSSQFGSKKKSIVWLADEGMLLIPVPISPTISIRSKERGHPALADCNLIRNRILRETWSGSADDFETPVLDGELDDDASILPDSGSPIREAECGFALFFLRVRVGPSPQRTRSASSTSKDSENRRVLV
eukprot:2074755-Rhodomonas_salina.3